MQIGSHFTDNEAGPYIVQTASPQSGFQLDDKRIEHTLIGQTTMNFFRPHFIGNRGKTVRPAECFGMFDQLHRTFSHQMYIYDFPFGNMNIDSRIDMYQIVTGSDRSFERFLNRSHSSIGIPFLDGLYIFQPRPSVVHGHDIGPRIIDCPRLHTQHIGKNRLSHSGISSVAIDLIKCRRKFYRRIISLSRTECRFNDRHRIGAHGQQRAGYMLRFFQFGNPPQDIFSFRLRRFHVVRFKGHRFSHLPLHGIYFPKPKVHRDSIPNSPI